MRSEFALIAIALLFAASTPATASVNMRITDRESSKVTFKLSKGSLTDDVDTITTTSTASYFRTRGLIRDLSEGEVYLTFEYTSSADVQDVQLSFATMWGGDSTKSISYKELTKTKDWTTCTVDISDVRKATGWGSFGDAIRFDLSCDAGVTLSVRHLRICKGSDDPWEPTVTMPADVASIFELGLPVINIETEDGEEPTCDYVDHPAGSFGSGITNTTKVPGKLDIYASNSTTPDYTSGEYQKDMSGMTVRLRGNTSAYGDKKPYKIKLQKKANLMLSGKDKTYKDKDWVLIKAPNLFTVIGHKIGEMMCMQWVPRCRFVNVIMNGDYRGLYLLAESVKRNTDARINVAEDGFIFELDPYWWNEDGQYLMSKFNPQCNYTFKYPDWEDMTESTTDYILSTLATFENSIAQGTYTKYIDVESFVSWLLVHDLFGTWDGAGCNLYFTKYDSSDESLIRMGNVWDFDTAEEMTDAWSGVHSYFFNQFFKSQNKAFARAYVKRWDEIKGTFFSDILDYVDSIAASDEGKGYDNSVKYDNVRWTFTNNGIDTEVAQHHDWFDSRKIWLQNAIAAVTPDDDLDALDDVHSHAFTLRAEGSVIRINYPKPGSLVEVYDVTGRRVYTGTDSEVDVRTSGVYVVRVEGECGKVLVR